MDRLYEICDDMASTDQFVTLRSIMERFYGVKISKLEGNREYGRLILNVIVVVMTIRGSNIDG